MKYVMHPHHWEITARDLDAAGHERVTSLDEADVLIFTSGNPRDFPERLPANIGWVQYGFTGVNHLIKRGLIKGGGVRWCNTAGAFAMPVAESALALLLAQAHQHKAAGMQRDWSKNEQLDAAQAWLYSAKGQGAKEVAVVGAGGIGKALIAMLKPFGVRIVAVNRSGREVPGADRTVPASEAASVWPTADFVVLTMPHTPETDKLIGREALKAMKDSAILVNVGRGKTVDTDALVWALESGEIAGAGLEVVDPEPLPSDHALWGLPNCTITPHIAANGSVAMWHLGEIVNANAAAFAAGETMPTEVDPERGY